MRHWLMILLLAVMALPVAAQTDDQVQVARDAFVAGDHAAALPVIRSAANAGHMRAQNLLGAAHQYGQGVDQDATLALQWMQRSADQGYPPALHNLGYLYETGMPGLAIDFAKAREFYIMAAALDYGASMGALGSLLYYAQGGPADLTRATIYFRRGADLGDPLSSEWLAYLHVSGEGIPENQIEARRLYQIAALHGIPSAANSYGEMLEWGEGGPVDLSGALENYLIGIEGDEAFAGINAAWLHFSFPEEFPDMIDGAAYCLWAIENAPPENLVEWEESCQAETEGMSEADLRLARKRANAM